jgi:hypothetical protein
MELKAAIERAVRFCPKGKTTLATLQAVRFAPQSNNCPSVIYSTSGHLGTIVELRDVDLPNALLPVGALRKAIKSAKSVDSIREIRPGVLELVVTAKKSKEQMPYEIECGDIANFPGYPDVPPPMRFQPIPGWDSVLKVVAATGKAAHKPDLKLVRFHSQHVTATDLEWLIRLNRPLGWDGWLLADVFRTWPRGEVQVAWEPPYAFFRIGEETRFAALQPETRYQDAFGRYCQYVPKHHVVLSRIVLEDTIKRAQDVSPWKMVMMDFGDTSVTVRAFARNREADAEASFAAYIPYERANIVPMQVLIDSTILVEILKLVESPMLRFRIEAPGQPLQVESGDLQFVLNPMEWKKDEHQRN